MTRPPTTHPTESDDPRERDRDMRIRRNVRGSMLLAIVAVLALVAGACGGGDEPTAEDTATEAATGPATEAATGEAVDITIGWTPPDITGVFQTATDFFEQAAEQAGEHGFDVEVLSRSPATHTAFNDQVGIVEDYVTQGVDVIAISPADTEALQPAIQQANEAGIPVIMVNLLSEQEGIDIASYIGFDNNEAAQVTAYAVLDYFGGPGVLGSGEEVSPPEDGQLDLEFWQNTYSATPSGVGEAGGVIIEGIAGSFFSNERLAGFNNVLESYSGIEILAEPIAADWNREQGTSAAEDFLSRFEPAPQGQLDFMWGASGEMAIGAMQAAERAGVLDSSGGGTPPEDGTVAIFSNDVTPESTSLISEGQIIAETHHGFAEWGWLGTETAVRIACGLEVEQFRNINPRIAWEGNAEDFYPDPQLPEIDWEGMRADCQPPEQG